MDIDTVNQLFLADPKISKMLFAAGGDHIFLQLNATIVYKSQYFAIVHYIS